MDFISLKKLYEVDTDYPPRTFDILMYRRVLNGTMYDILRHSFHENSRTYNGETHAISIYERRPCVKECIAKEVVMDVVSLLFGDDHFPKITLEDKESTRLISILAESSNLKKEMLCAAHDGSVGSAAVLFKILNGKIYFENILTEFLIPFYSAQEPGLLVKVKQKYKVNGYQLPFLGYDESSIKLNQVYWIVREWTTTEEIVYLPFLANNLSRRKSPDLIVDKERSFCHNLGFVPIIWVKNLPSSNNGSVDGQCTFKDAIDTNITIDYLLSQGNRGLNYSLEPLLVVSDQSFGTSQGEINLAESNVLRVSKDGKAGHAEISGNATDAVIAYTDHLRRIALQNIHGNRSDPDKASFAQSGKAMEILHLTLIWLTSQMRITYGEEGLKNLIGMVIKANQLYSLYIGDEFVQKGTLKPGSINLKWGEWFSATIDDKQKKAQTVITLKDAGVISSETSTREIADDYAIIDFEKEIELIAIDKANFLEENPKITEIIQG